MSELAIAFDVGTLEQALALDRRLGAGPELAKVGLQLFASAGPDASRDRPATTDKSMRALGARASASGPPLRPGSRDRR